jgi:ParB-like chromosome segregation protein Spo0J
MSLNDAAIKGFSKEIVAGSVKAAMRGIGASSGDLWQAPIDQIKVMPGFNPRIRDAALKEHIESLAQSIEVNGFYRDKPLAVIVANEGGENVIYVVDGHNRLEGALLAKERGAPLETLPVVTKDRSITMEDLTVALVRSGEGKRLTPYELSIVVKRLSSFNRAEKEIAALLGFTENYVKDLLRIAGAPAKIRETVQSGAVSVGVAVASLKKHGSDAVTVIDQAVKAAKESGKARASAKHMPGHADRSFERKNGGAAIALLRRIAEPDVLKLLPERLAKAVSELLTPPEAGDQKKRPPKKKAD